MQFPVRQTYALNAQAIKLTMSRRPGGSSTSRTRSACFPTMLMNRAVRDSQAHVARTWKVVWKLEGWCWAGATWESDEG